MQRLVSVNFFPLSYDASNFDHHAQILIYGCDNSRMVVTTTLLNTLTVLCASPRTQMKSLYTYRMKGVGYPQFYLGGDVAEFPPSWKSKNVSFYLSDHTYIKNCVSNLEQICNTTFAHTNTPMNPLYHPETDTTALCSTSEHSKYRSLIGSANWMITLGRFDINYAVNTLAQ